MKKVLFASILAIVALSGAYATDYSTGPNSTGTKFRCAPGNAPTCLTSVGSTTIIYVLGSSIPTTLPPSEYNYHYGRL